MTDEQARSLIIAIKHNIERFIPRDFQKSISQTDQFRWAISDIVRNAEFYITGEHSRNIHQYDDLIKSELDRLSK